MSDTTLSTQLRDVVQQVEELTVWLHRLADFQVPQNYGPPHERSLEYGKLYGALVFRSIQKMTRLRHHPVLNGPCPYSHEAVMEMRLLFQELWDRFDFQWCETTAGGAWLPRAINHVGKDQEAWDALLGRLEKSVEWVRALANGLEDQKKQEEPLPSQPTPEFCLLPGKWVRWEGKVELKNSEYRLFKRLLEHRWDRIEVARVKEDVWVGKRGRDDGDISDKTVQNTLYELINSLAAIHFPIEWEWHYTHIVRKSIR